MKLPFREEAEPDADRLAVREEQGKRAGKEI